MKDKKIRVLMIGPQERPDREPGGCGPIFQLFLEHLNGHDDMIATAVSTLLPKRRIRRFLAAIWVMLAVLFRLPFYNVIIYCVHPDRFYTLRYVLFLTKLFKKPLIVKKFAKKSHTEITYGKKREVEVANITSLLRKVDLYVPETLHAVQTGMKSGIKTMWTPNVRKTFSEKSNHGSQSDRFQCVFIGHILVEKGIREIIACDSLLNPGILINIYGPFLSALGPDDFKNLRNIVYRGVLERTEVLSTMKKHDCFLLPTYSEGHNGSLIEAFSLGLPIITTNRDFNHEIVSNENALIIDAQSVSQLADAINRLAGDKELQKRLSAKAYERSSFFDIEPWGRLMADCCRRLAKGENFPDAYLDPQQLISTIFPKSSIDFSPKFLHASNSPEPKIG